MCPAHILPVEKRGRDWRLSEALSRGIWAGSSASCLCPCAVYDCCGLPHKVSPQDFCCGAAASVRRVQLPGNECQGCRKETGGSRKEDEGSCGSRMGLTASVVEPRGVVFIVCGESLVKTQPSHVPPSECVLAPLESGPVRPQTFRCCFAACSCGIGHQALHGSSSLGIVMKRRCLLLNIAATATFALPNGLFFLFSYCSHHPKLADGVEYLQPPWCLPTLNRWWARPGAGGPIPVPGVQWFPGQENGISTVLK